MCKVLTYVDSETCSDQVWLQTLLRCAPALEDFSSPAQNASQGLISPRYRKNLIVIYRTWFTFLPNTMRENAHGETDPR